MPKIGPLFPHQNLSIKEDQSAESVVIKFMVQKKQWLQSSCGDGRPVFKKGFPVDCLTVREVMVLDRFIKKN